jgi:hypothetical protein
MPGPPVRGEACDLARSEVRSEGFETPSLLIRSYLHRVQRRPDRFTTWRSRQPLVLARPPGSGSRSPGWLPSWLPGSLAGQAATPARIDAPHGRRQDGGNVNYLEPI